MLREKWHWDEQIVKLGGPNYHKVGPKVLDNDGKEIKGAHGYKCGGCRWQWLGSFFQLSFFF